jgi:hypothetical protein
VPVILSVGWNWVDERFATSGRNQRNPKIPEDDLISGFPEVVASKKSDLESFLGKRMFDSL